MPRPRPMTPMPVLSCGSPVHAPRPRPLPPPPKADPAPRVLAAQRRARKPTRHDNQATDGSSLCQNLLPTRHRPPSAKPTAARRIRAVLLDMGRRDPGLRSQPRIAHSTIVAAKAVRSSLADAKSAAGQSRVDHHHPRQYVRVLSDAQHSPGSLSQISLICVSLLMVME
jgi:hypothetical protein